MCTTQGYRLQSNMEMQPGKSVPTPDQTGRKVVYQTSGYDAHDCWCVKNRTFSPQAASYFFFYFSRYVFVPIFMIVYSGIQVLIISKIVKFQASN